jgi:hypothetical protein
VSRSVSQKEIKLLCLQSGGVCAFPGCGRYLVEAGTLQDDPVVLGEIAHIVAESRQGPRGTAALTEEERNKHANLILLCGDHHKIIDSQPNTYSIPVLRQMKADHEARIRKAMTSTPVEPQQGLKSEVIPGTLLTATHLPTVVFAAPCPFDDGQEDAVKQYISYPTRREELVPFLLREKKLIAFHDLQIPNNPFAVVIDRQNVEIRRALDLWRDAEGKRRYTTLMNRSLYKHTGRLAIRYDPTHYRFYFPATEKGRERVVWYRSVSGKQTKRKVVWQPKRRSTGERRNFWWHLAARLRFHQMAELQWCLSIRPERHLTRDGESPLPSEQIGRRVTRLKARMYNDLYLAEVNFWRDYLAQGRPRFILDFGNQSAVVDAQGLMFDVHWPGIPGDDRLFHNQLYQDDLFTLADLDEAVSGEETNRHDSEDETIDEEDADEY